MVFVLVVEYWTSSLSSEGYSKVRGSLLSLHGVDLGKGFSLLKCAETFSSHGGRLQPNVKQLGGELDPEKG